MPKEKPPARIRFIDKKGRFVSAEKRYEKDKVARVQVKRRNRYVDVIVGKVTPEKLADVTSRQEFESLPPAHHQVAEFKSTKKYKAWDIAGKINSTKRVRRKLLRVTMEIDDKGRKRKVDFYTRINRNSSAQYNIFSRMNEALTGGKFFLYDRVSGKKIEGRKGKKVSLLRVTVDEVL